MNRKTKQMILLISTILTALINIGYAIAIYSGAIELTTVEDLVQMTNSIQIGLLCLCAFVNLISTIFIAQDFIVHKKKLIIFNVIQILFGTIFNIVFGIVNIVLLATKTKDVEEVKEKKELPVLEDITKHKWYVYFTIFVFLFTICYTPILDLLPIPNTKIAATIFIVTLYIIQIVMLVIPMFNELKRDFKIFKDNFKLYLSKMLPRFGIIIIVYFICNLCLMLFINNMPSNQAILLSLPIYITAFLAIIIAPLIEELMFRGFMRKFIKNDILYLLFSSLIFGGLHVTSADSLHQVLFIIPYSILGFAFAQNYLKTKNIASNIFLHSVWNSIAVIAMALLKFL